MTGFRDDAATQSCWVGHDEVDSDSGDGAEPSWSCDMTGESGQSTALLDRLLLTIESEIIPRLVVAHRQEPRALPAWPATDYAPGSEDVEALTAATLRQDVDMTQACVEEIRERGADVETIYLALLAPTARRLGELWKQDRCSFMDVTIGLGRLQQAMRELSREFQIGARPWEQGRRALLVPARGEQHSFGLQMVAEFLRRAGWDVTSEPAMARQEVVASVGNEWFAVIGFSLSREDGLDELTAQIREVRAASRNGTIGVMVGGRVFVEQPHCVAQVGADVTATDGRQAVLQAECLHVSLFAER